MNAESVDTLREQIDRIRLIVQQMTAFSHPDQSGWETLPLNDVVAGGLQLVQFDHRLRDVEVIQEFSPDIGHCTIIPHAIQQVIVNMILNALDAMSDVARPRITLATNMDDGHPVIEISDNGHGIEAEQLHRIFEPFYTTKPVGKGTGLGLSISFSLIQQLGGTCEVTSEPEKGTTFLIHLPGIEAQSGDREANRAQIPDSENS